MFTFIRNLKKSQAYSVKGSLRKLFLTYVRPIMEYACVVWSGAPIQLLAKLDNILVQGMRIATGAPAR